MHIFLRVLTVVIFVSLASCAVLKNVVSPPKVSVSNIEALSSQGFQPRFAVDLTILNPNSVPIPISGISYEISLNNYEIFSGVTNNVPTIPAYGEIPLRVEVTADLLQSIGFLTQLFNGKLSVLAYSIDAKVKVGGVTMPFNITEAGQVAFSQ